MFIVPYIIITISTICILVFLLSCKNSYSIPLHAVAFFTGFAGITIAKHSMMEDVELWGGTVTIKDSSSSICNHTRTICSGSGKSETCTTVKDHIMDYYFWVKTDYAGDWVDKCGDCFPPSWWEQTSVGDHVAIPHTYQNYLLADENSLARPSDLDGDGRLTILDYPVLMSSHTRDEFKTATVKLFNY